MSFRRRVLRNQYNQVRTRAAPVGTTGKNFHGIAVPLNRTARRRSAAILSPILWRAINEAWTESEYQKAIDDATT